MTDIVKGDRVIDCYLTFEAMTVTSIGEHWYTGEPEYWCKDKEGFFHSRTVEQLRKVEYK